MFCTQVKEFLHTQNVGFTDRDITSDDSALAELGRLRVMTTPVTVVDGETVVGYDVNRLKALLGVRLNVKTHWEHIYTTKASDESQLVPARTHRVTPSARRGGDDDKKSHHRHWRRRLPSC
jgi:glutaredoxin